VDAARAEHVEEKRSAPIALDERSCLAEERVTHFLVFPQCRLAASHVADARDTVDDSLGMTMAGMHREQLWIVFARRLAWKIVYVADAYRIVGIEAHDAAVFYI
jgi:hypothetical protein